MINRSLPLTDLHRHLDGNIRLSTILDLARQHNLPLFPLLYGNETPSAC